jgi:NitT/TauT family transport system substrate-binding protein
MRRKSALRSSVAIAALLALTACDARQQAPLRIGVNLWPGYLSLHCAEEQGWFEAEGCSVQVVEFSSLADIRRAFERGRIDMACCTLVEYAIVDARSDRAPSITWLFDASSGGDELLARRDIPKLEALRGKRIGVDSDALPIYLLKRALEQNGLELADVELVQLDMAQLDLAWQQDRIDAAVCYPPVSLQLKKTRGAHSLFTSRQIPREILDILICSREVLTERAEHVEALHRALAKAQRQVHLDPRGQAALAHDHVGLSAEDLSAVLREEIEVFAPATALELLRNAAHFDRIWTGIAAALRESGAELTTTLAAAPRLAPHPRELPVPKPAPNAAEAPR